MWDKVFKSGPSKICGRQPLKTFKGYGLLEYFVSYIIVLHWKYFIWWVWIILSTHFVFADVQLPNEKNITGAKLKNV